MMTDNHSIYVSLLISDIFSKSLNQLINWLRGGGVLALLIIISARVGEAAVPYAPQAKMAIIDVQAVLDNSLAVKDIRKTIDAISEQLHREMSTKELQLKKAEEDLVKQRGRIKPSLYEEEARRFDTLVSDAQHDLQQKKLRLEKAHATAIAQVHEVMMRLISELAKAEGYSLVLPNSQILYMDSELDITSRVAELLNKELSSMKVSY